MLFIIQEDLLKINKNILNSYSYLQVHGEIRTQKEREKKIHQDIVYTT